MKAVLSLVLVLSSTIALASPSIPKDETLPKEGSPSVIEGPDGSSIVSSVKPGFITKNTIKGPSAVSTVIGPDTPKETEQDQLNDEPFHEKKLKPSRPIRPKPVLQPVQQVIPGILPERPLSFNGLLSLLQNKPSRKPILPPSKLPPIQKPPGSCQPIFQPPVIQPPLPLPLPPQHTCPHHVPGRYPPPIIQPLYPQISQPLYPQISQPLYPQISQPLYPQISQPLYPQISQPSLLVNGLLGNVLQSLLLSSLQPNLQSPSPIYMPPTYVPPHLLRPKPYDVYIDNFQVKYKETMENENHFAVAENQITLQDVQPFTPVYTPHNLIIPSYYDHPWTKSAQKPEEPTTTVDSKTE